MGKILVKDLLQVLPDEVNIYAKRNGEDDQFRHDGFCGNLLGRNGHPVWKDADHYVVDEISEIRQESDGITMKIVITNND